MSNLNATRSLHPQWQPKSIHGDVLILFDDIENELLALIARSKKIVGCVAWFTSPAVLNALKDKQVSIIVQRDTMFSPRSNKTRSISDNLKRLYTAVPSNLTISESSPFNKPLFDDQSSFI